MFDVGALIFRIQTAGLDVFGREMAQADRDFQKVAQSAKAAKTDVDGAGGASDKTGESFRRTRPKVKELGTELANLSDEGRQAAKEVGGTLVLAGGALIAMTGLAVKAAIDWETAWAGVTKTVDGNAQEMATLQGELRDLTGVLPAAHEEIAAVAEAAGQLGVQRENISSFTRTMIDLGETTNLSATEAATALARFMNVMGTSQSQVSNLGSAVVELGNNYATTEAEIVAMASRLSGAGRQIGLTEGEVLGLATSLSSVGIEAEAGGSAVSKVMIDIAASVDAGGERLETFARVAGVSADDFAEKWRTDPGAALATFVQGLANAEAQGSSTLGILADLGITEVRMRDALLRSAAASDQFTAAMEQGNEAFEENTALQDEAAKRYETTASQLAIAGNNARDAAIDFGTVFLPAVVAASEAVSEIAGLLGALPEPVKALTSFLGLGAGAVALFGGALLLGIPKIVEFRAAQSTLAREMPKTTAAMRGVTGLLFGPWGLAFTAGIAALGAFGAAQENARQRTDAYASTLEEGTNRITAATRQMVQDQLAAKRSADLLGFSLGELPSIYDRVEQLQSNGVAVSTALVTDAALGQVDAMKQLKAIFDTSRETFQGSQDEYEEMDSLIRAVTDAVGGQNVSIEEAIRKQEQVADATGDATVANEESADAARTSADAYMESADATAAMRDELTSLIDTMNAVNGLGQDAVSTNARYQASLADIAETAVEAGTSLDQNTVAGSANADMLSNVARDAQKAAEAQRLLDEQTMSAEDASTKYNETLASQQQKLIDAAVAAGFSADEVEALAGVIFNLPDEREVAIIAETAAAQSSIEAFIRRNAGRRFNVYLDAISSGGGGGRSMLQQADGGKVEFYSGGGRSENHVAQFARAGTWRVWAEPETGGEWYIPASPAKRARSTQVLAQAAGEFGYQLVPAQAASFADGGSYGTPAPISAGGDTHFHVNMPALPAPDADRVVREFVDEVKWLNNRP